MTCLSHLNQICDVSETSEKYLPLVFVTFQKYSTKMVSCDFHWVIEIPDKEDDRLLLTLNPAEMTFSGGLKKIMTSYDQTKRLHDVWQKTSNLRRLEDVAFASSWRRLN